MPVQCDGRRRGPATAVAAGGPRAAKSGRRRTGPRRSPGACGREGGWAGLYSSGNAHVCGPPGKGERGSGVDLATFHALLEPAGQALLAEAVALAPTEATLLACLTRLRRDHPPALAAAAL